MTGIYSDHLTEPVWNWLVAAANFTASRLSFPLAVTVDVLSTITLMAHSLLKWSNHNLSLGAFHPHSCRSAYQGHFQPLRGFNCSQIDGQGGSFSLLASGLVTAVVCTLPFMSGSSGIERLLALWRETFGGDDMLQACNLVAFLKWMFMSCYYHNCGSRCQKTTSLKYLSLCFTCFVRSKYHALWSLFLCWPQCFSEHDVDCPSMKAGH